VRFTFIFIPCFLFSLFTHAQLALLPSLQIETQNAQNKISWNSQYDGIKSIAVQRSNDSVKNFSAIGTINNPKKGMGSFLDQHPLVGKNFYRLSIEFAGDVNWSSNIYKVMLDSATIAQSLESKLNTGLTNAKIDGSSTVGKNSANANGTTATDFYYTPSSHIYTNSYTGHINISLGDAVAKKYNVRFLDPNKNEVLKISRILKTHLILDKNNFNNKGTYKFELLNGQELVETGFVTIY
jgi:hypothetical protein